MHGIFLILEYSKNIFSLKSAGKYEYPAWARKTIFLKKRVFLLPNTYILFFSIRELNFAVGGDYITGNTQHVHLSMPSCPPFSSRFYGWSKNAFFLPSSVSLADHKCRIPSLGFVRKVIVKSKYLVKAGGRVFIFGNRFFHYKY